MLLNKCDIIIATKRINYFTMKKKFFDTLVLCWKFQVLFIPPTCMHKVFTALYNGGGFKTALQSFVREDTNYTISSASAEKMTDVRRTTTTTQQDLTTSCFMKDGFSSKSGTVDAKKTNKQNKAQLQSITSKWRFHIVLRLQNINCVQKQCNQKHSQGILNMVPWWKGSLEIGTHCAQEHIS